MWDLGPSELAAVMTGGTLQRTWLYELALFTAWHTAAFNGLAKVGKLKDWSEYRRKFTGTTVTTTVPAVSWKERKAERQRQLEQLKKHQEKRKGLPKRRG